MLRGNSLLTAVTEGKNGAKENKRKTKTENAGLFDGRQYWKAKRRGPTRGVMTSYIRTCLGGRESEGNEVEDSIMTRSKIPGGGCIRVLAPGTGNSRNAEHLNDKLHWLPVRF